MYPFTLLIKPAGPDCNLACTYCFYAKKSRLFGCKKHRMNDKVVETLVRDYMQLGFSTCSFAWQGGEPTLMGLDFYRKVIELQTQYGQDGQTVGNALQTNAIVLADDEWGRFLHDNNVLVGISLDGPKSYHDHYRLDHAGRGSFDRVAAAIETCRNHDVQFNILVLLNDRNVTAPDEIFDYLIDMDIEYMQFIPCVEQDEKTGSILDFSITPRQYGAFLCRIFDRWYEYGPRKISVRMFDSILSYCLQGRHTICTFSPKCDQYVVVEHNGDVFVCDFFVEEQWRLGNLLETPLGELASSTRKRRFAQHKRKVHNQCLVCRYHDMCRGGCLKERLVSGDSYQSVSYLCEGYKMLFEHAMSKFMELAASLRLESSPPGGQRIT